MYVRLFLMPVETSLPFYLLPLLLALLSFSLSSPSPLPLALPLPLLHPIQIPLSLPLPPSPSLSISLSSLSLNLCLYRSLYLPFPLPHPQSFPLPLPLSEEGGLEACLNPESEDRLSEEGSQQVLVACGAILAPNGDVLTADSTICAAMSDALLSSIGEAEAEHLAVKVGGDSSCVRRRMHVQ